MTIYNYDHRDKIKDLVRLSKHANVLVLMARGISTCFVFYLDFNYCSSNLEVFLI